MLPHSRLLWAAALVALLPSCVYMQEPFTDDDTSVADARLIGRWEDRDMPIDGKTFIYEIRKSEGTRNTLEVCGDRRDDDEPSAIYVRRGKPALMCVESAGIGREDQPGRTTRSWLPYKYEFPDEKTLRLFPLHREFIRAAIGSGELTGSYTGPFEGDPVRPIPTDDERRAPVIDIGQEVDSEDGWHIILESSAEDVLAFIGKHGDKAFEEEPIVLTRVPENRRPSCESTKPATNDAPTQP